MELYLGTHQTQWLPRAGVSLFVSHRRLAGRKSLPIAAAPWCLDSGGFSELSLYGEWRTSPDAYVAAARRYRDEIGNLRWAAIQDWMCEPAMLARTRLTLRKHQRRTIISYLTLTDKAPDVPWIPVLQGWTLDDYFRHLCDYDKLGIRLYRAPVVGLGSVCRRQHSDEIGAIVKTLAGYSLRLHGFGVKQKGLIRYGKYLVSADSLAWSYDARRKPAQCGSVTHKNCANCLPYALSWYERTKVLAGG